EKNRKKGKVPPGRQSGKARQSSKRRDAPAVQLPFAVGANWTGLSQPGSLDADSLQAGCNAQHFRQRLCRKALILCNLLCKGAGLSRPGVGVSPAWRQSQLDTHRSAVNGSRERVSGQSAGRRLERRGTVVFYAGNSTPTIERTGTRASGGPS